MLMLAPGAMDVARVHGAFVGEDEVRAICDHLRAQGKPSYDANVLHSEVVAPREHPRLSEGAGDGGERLYDDAKALVAEAGHCSVIHCNVSSASATTVQPSWSSGCSQRASLASEGTRAAMRGDRGKPMR
jgi:DNA segregation ATPase FtsK/SpoIIIE-like protein